jgi:hypothetical protein
MMFSSSPNRTDCVNDKSRGQPIAASNFRFTGSTAAQGPAFCEQFRSRGAMDCAINSSAAEEGCIRRIYDGIHIEPRDVAANDFDLARNSLFQAHPGYAM